MMRVLVASITGIFIALYMMYFAIPLLSTEHTMMTNPLLINATDPTVVTSFNLGQGFYTVMPMIPILVAGFLVISYALKSEGGG